MSKPLTFTNKIPAKWHYTILTNLGMQGLDPLMYISIDLTICSFFQNLTSAVGHPSILLLLFSLSTSMA